MMNTEKRSSQNGLKHFILLIVLSCQSAAGWCQSPQERLKENSVIVLRQFGDYGNVNATLACSEGAVTAVVKMEDYGLPAKTLFPAVDLQTYLNLWKEMEEAGIWELPSGEFWPHRELIEAQGSRSGIRLSEADVDTSEYARDFLSPKSLVEVRIRVKGREYGFLRYHPENLKDLRYYCILEAIYRAGVEEALKELIKKDSGGRDSRPENGSDGDGSPGPEYERRPGKGPQ